MRMVRYAHCDHTVSFILFFAFFVGALLLLCDLLLNYHYSHKKRHVGLNIFFFLSFFLYKHLEVYPLVEYFVRTDLISEMFLTLSWSVVTKMWP